MARLVREREGQGQASASSGADDLDTLFPDVEATIAGEAVTFREYRFMDWLRHGVLLKPIVEAIADRAMAAAEITPDTIMDAVTAHHEHLPDLVAAATGKQSDWFEGLNDADGKQALEAWLAAELGFFVRRAGDALTRRVMEAVSGGPTSSPASSPAATASTRSAATPSAS